MAEPYYCTADQLRAVAGVNDTVLPDPAAIEIIQDAEDQIDEALGAWAVNETTGRKIFEDDVDAWRFTKLGRATVKLAAAIYASPTNSTSPRYRRERGPDFEVEDPLGSTLGDAVEALLNQTGLRRLTTSFDGRSLRPPWYDFVINDTSWDYDPPPLPRQT